MEKIQLTISLLASNRPDTLRKCLDSLKPIQEAISCELILVDTSKNPDVGKMLLEYTDQVYPFEWCNDFSKARNVGLGKAKGEWFLFLDDDEWFVETEPLIEFFQSGDYKNYGYAHYQVRNFYDVSYTYYSDAWVSRMARVEKDTRFVSKIHEYMYPVGGKDKYIEAMVYHSGYIYATEEEKLAHFDRNAKLLLQMMEEEPENLRWKIQLCQEYRSVRKYEELWELCESSLEKAKTFNQEEEFLQMGTFYGAYVEACLRMQDYKKAKDVAQRALGDVRNTLLCAAYIQLSLAEAHFFLEEWTEAEKCVAEYLEIHRRLCQKKDVLENMRRALIIQETFDDNNLKKAFSIRICCDLKLRHSVKCLEEDYEKLAWKDDVIYVFLGMEKVLAWAMANLEYHPIFTVVAEDAARNEGLKYYMDEAVAACIKKYGQLQKFVDVYGQASVETWEGYIDSLSREGILVLEMLRETLEAGGNLSELKELYFKKVYARDFMKLTAFNESYEALLERFRQFSDSTLSYYEKKYAEVSGWKADAHLSEDVKAALILQRMFSRAEGKWEEKIADLKECIEQYPALAENIKSLAHMMVEKSKESIGQTTQNANAQLKQMIELMKEKIILMASQGMRQEALNVLMQVRNLAPDDMELLEMEEELKK